LILRHDAGHRLVGIAALGEQFFSLPRSRVCLENVAAIFAVTAGVPGVKKLGSGFQSALSSPTIARI